MGGAILGGACEPAVCRIEALGLGGGGAVTPLIAPAAEGIHSVELANAMLYSTFINDTVTLPLDATAYEAALLKKISANPLTLSQI